jgi:hypothetical protein
VQKALWAEQRLSPVLLLMMPRANLEELATQGPATAERAYGQARDQMSGAAAAVASSVEQQPFVIPLAVGLVCGTACFLLGRR